MADNDRDTYAKLLAAGMNPAGPPTPGMEFGPPSPPQEPDLATSAGYDPIADAEANANGNIKPILNSLGQPIQTPKISNVEMVPQYNSAGQIVGQTPRVTYAKAPGISGAPATAPAVPISAPPSPATATATAAAGVIRASPTSAQQPRPAVPGAGMPDFAGQIGKTYDQQIAAQRAANQAAVNANDAQVVGDAQVSGLQAQQAEEAAKAAKEHDDAIARQLQQIHALSDDAAAMRVDSNRWWHNQSTGQQVGYTIAAALGGFAAGWNKGPNLAMDQINRNIDRDIDDQKMAIEQARGKVTDARGILGEMYTRFGTMDKAVAATKLLQTNAAINDTKAQVAAAQSPGVEANGNILLAGLQREKIQAQQRFIAASQPKAIDFGKLHELSKDLEGDRSVAGEQALANLRAMDKTGQGDIPGSSLGGRILGSLAEPGEDGRRGFVATLANAARGTEAREAQGGLYQLAEASLPPSIRGSPEAVKNQLSALFGSGSPEEVKAGMQRAEALIGAQKANAYSGQKPETVAAYEALNNAYGARTAPKPGLPSGSTP